MKNLCVAIAFLLLTASLSAAQTSPNSQWSNFPQSSSFFPIGVFDQNPIYNLGAGAPYGSTDAVAMPKMGITVSWEIDGGSNGAGWPCSYGTDCGANSSTGQFADLASKGVYVIPAIETSDDTGITSIASIQAAAGSNISHLAGYGLGDEPGCSGVLSSSQISTLGTYDNPPSGPTTRPIIENFANWIFWQGGLTSCTSTAVTAEQALSINSIDHYAMIHDNLGWIVGTPVVTNQSADFMWTTGWTVNQMVANARSGEPIWFYPDSGTDALGMSSGNGSSCNVSTNLCTPDNHEERATSEQVNAEAWMVLINGGMGIVWFCQDSTSDEFCLGDQTQGNTALATTIANNLDYIDGAILTYAPEIQSTVLGSCTMNTGVVYAPGAPGYYVGTGTTSNSYTTSCSGGILSMVTTTTAVSSVSASESGTTATFTAGSNYGAAFVVDSPIIVSGCSVSGYNTTWGIASGGAGSTSLTAIASTGVSGLGAATGCTVTSAVPGSAIVKNYNGTPYLFADSDRNGSATMTFTLSGYAGQTATVVYDSNAQYDPSHSSVGNTFTLNASGQFSDTFGANGHNYQPKIYKITGADPPAPPTSLNATVQ